MPAPDPKEQIALDAAAADLEAKRLANDKARQELVAARAKATSDALGAAVPDLAARERPAVGFSQGATLRQGEATALALADAAAQVARAVAAATPAGARVHVTADPHLLDAVVRHRRLVAEATLLSSAAEKAAREAKAALARSAPEPGSRKPGLQTVPLEARARGASGLVGVAGAAALLPVLGPAALLAAPVLGEVATQVAALTEIEVDARGERADLPARSVHAAVMAALLRGEAPVEITHETHRVPSGDSALLGLVTDLVRWDRDLVGPALELDAAVAALGDPAADLAAARKARDAAAPDSPERERAEQAEQAATERAGRLAALTSARTAVRAAATTAAAFVQQVVTVAGGGPSPLGAATGIEAVLGDGEDAPYVLLVGGASAESSQLLVTRRLFASWVQTATAVDLDHVLVRGDRVVAAGRAHGAASFHGRIRGKGVVWQRVVPLAETPRQG